MITERRYTQTTRVFEILKLLRQFYFGLSTLEIAERLADKIDEPVDIRTVYRDVRFLIEIGLVSPCPKQNYLDQRRFRFVKRSELAELLPR